jgi:hypothetical protein
MNAATYYRHIRSLGAFRAVDALALAREAVELDQAAANKARVPFVDVWAEDGCKFSRAVRVY